MSTEVKPKIIGSYWFRSKTVGGNLSKLYCYVYDNGVTVIIQYILSKDESMPRCTKRYSKFGYNLFIRDFALKYNSLFNIARITTEILNKANIKKEDIV